MSYTEHLFRLSTELREVAAELEGTEALELLSALALDIDAYTREQVARCRRADVTWSAIGNAMAVSKQAAAQRYGRA